MAASKACGDVRHAVPGSNSRAPLPPNPVLALVLAASSACSFDAAVDAHAQLRCASNDACPPAWHCFAASVCIEDSDDRQAPALLSLHVDPPRAKAGDVVAVEAVFDEALLEPPAIIIDGGRAFAFDAGAGTFFRATVVVDTDDGEGAHTIDVDAVDAAGNSAESSTVDALELDFTAPAVVGDATLTLFPPPSSVAATTTRLARGGRAVVTFAVDDAAADIEVTARLQGGTGSLAFTRTAIEPPTFELVPATAPPTGTYDVVATLTDDVGNTAAVTLDVSLVADPIVPSPCLAVDETGAPVCTDFDGDGFFGMSDACPSGDDCDDEDPLTYPGAFEIPGDGKGNACDGGPDLAVDEDAGVFVSPDGDDTGDGSRTAPLLTLAAAFTQADALDKRFVFLRAGSFATGGVTVTASMVGGLDADWQRGGRTAWTADGTSVDINVGAGVTLFDALDITLAGSGGTGVLAGGATVWSGCSVVDALTASSTAPLELADGLFVKSEATGAIEPEGTFRIIDSHVDGQLYCQGGSLVVVRSHIEHSEALIGCDVDIVASAFTDSEELLQTLDNGHAVHVAFSTFYAAGLNTNGVDVPDGNGVVLVNNVIVSEDRAVLLGNATTSAVFAGNILASTCPLAVEGSTCALITAEANDVDACAWSGCTSAVDDVALDPALLADHIHVAAATPIAGRGVNPAGFGVLTARAGDIDGQCRVTAAFTPGADEP